MKCLVYLERARAERGRRDACAPGTDRLETKAPTRAGGWVLENSHGRSFYFVAFTCNVKTTSSRMRLSAAPA
jgi:hypothetical protein